MVTVNLSSICDNKWVLLSVCVWVKLVEAEREVEVSHARNQQLQEQVEQLQEAISMQESGRGEASLLSELEQSFNNMSWSQDKEQVEPTQQACPLCPV